MGADGLAGLVGLGGRVGGWAGRAGWRRQWPRHEALSPSPGRRRGGRKRPQTRRAAARRAGGPAGERTGGSSELGVGVGVGGGRRGRGQECRAGGAGRRCDRRWCGRDAGAADGARRRRVLVGFGDVPDTGSVSGEVSLQCCRWSWQGAVHAGAGAVPGAGERRRPSCPSAASARLPRLPRLPCLGCAATHTPSVRIVSAGLAGGLSRLAAARTRGTRAKRAKRATRRPAWSVTGSITHRAPPPAPMSHVCIIADRPQGRSAVASPPTSAAATGAAHTPPEAP